MKDEASIGRKNNHKHIVVWVVEEVEKVLLFSFIASIALDTVFPGFVSVVISLDLFAKIVVVYSGVWCAVLAVNAWKNNK